MTDVALAIVALMAEDGPRDTGPDFGKASPLGLVVVVILMISTFTLVWSMNRHLKRLPASFDREHPEADQAVDDGTVGSLDEPAAGKPQREPGG